MLLRVKASCLTLDSSTKLKMQVLLYEIRLHMISSLKAYLGRRPKGQQSLDTGVFPWFSHCLSASSTVADGENSLKCNQN